MSDTILWSGFPYSESVHFDATWDTARLAMCAYGQDKGALYLSNIRNHEAV